MTVREAFLKYFAFSDEEFSAYYKKFNDKQDYKRLVEILKAVIPYCDQYLDTTDDKIKRKVGLVLISKLDYSSFAEKEDETYTRLHNFFKNTTEKGINPYKIIYCSVLTDAELKNDFEDNSKYPVATRKFLRIYDALKGTLNLTDQETVEIFEKCSTLISKVYSNRIPEIYNCLSTLAVNGEQKGFRIFNEKEVAEILKINPSLFTISNDKMISAYAFLKACVKPLAAQPHKKYYDDKEMDSLYAEALILRQWLKNNSTLLSINADVIQSKYNHLIDFVGVKTDHKYDRVLDSYFHDPITLSIISQMPYSEIRNNSFANIHMLDSLIHDKVAVTNYLKENPYFIAMPSNKVSELFYCLKSLDERSENIDYLQTFLDSGRSLFKGSGNFNVDDILEKIKNKSALPKIDVEHINGTELLDKFCEIYNACNMDIADTIKALIEKKNIRHDEGEKSIRRAIRYVGENLRHAVSAIIKDKKTPKLIKVRTLEQIVPVINYVKEARFTLAKTNSIYMAEETERKNSLEIENALNVVREIYELKKDKINEKYIGGDLLYKKLMDYLGTEFDDKKSIGELFHEDVTEEFKKFIIENFNAKKDDQITAFKTQGYVVPKMGENDGKIYSALKKMGEEIHATDSKFEIKFEK